MVICTQQVDGSIGTAATLIKVVGDVTSEVRCLTVGLNQNTVLVIAVRGRPQPNGSILVKDLAALTQSLNCSVNSSRIMERIFVEENVKFRAEITQALLDFIEHQLDATCAECLNSFFFGKSNRIGLPRCDGIFTHLRCNIGNVLAAVAIFRCLMAHRTRIERTRETIDLRTVIIEVVLASHLRT